MMLKSEKGMTLLETIIALAMLSVVFLAAYSIFTAYQESYIYQNAVVECQANARTAQNHILSNLRRCKQDGITIEGNDTLKLVSPSDGGDEDLVYEVENNTLKFTRGSNDAIDIARNIDTFEIERNGDIITFTIKTSRKALARTATAEVTASHRIRID